MKRGIFGLPQNRKLLFNINSELWSSDSEDSDFVISDSDDLDNNTKENEIIAKRICIASSEENNKYSEKLMIKNAKINTHRDENSFESSFILPIAANSKFNNSTNNLNNSSTKIIEENLWATRLPQLVLFKIFQEVVKTEGPIPFLCRASKICRSWNIASYIPSLWSNVDLSYGWIKQDEVCLKNFLQTRMMHLEHINLSYWTKLKNLFWNELGNFSSRLKCINLTKTTISGTCLVSLIQKCPCLDTLVLSFMQNETVSSKNLLNIFSVFKERLKSLTISNNKLVRFNSFLKVFSSTPSNLELFELNNNTITDNVIFDIEKSQVSWPKLHTLRLSNCHLLFSNNSTDLKSSNGFPMLVELSLCGLENIGAPRNILRRIARNSKSLTLLDLRNNKKCNVNDLIDCQLNNLEQVYLKNASTFDLFQVIEKWKHSLIELDISWINYDPTNFKEALILFSLNSMQSKLENLNLQGTVLDLDTLKILLEKCLNLKNINLSSCRNLPRGLKREYDAESIQILKQDLLNL